MSVVWLSMLEKHYFIRPWKTSDSIFSKIMIKNIKWLVVSIYRPPNDSNMNKFFQEMTTFFGIALKRN